MKNYVLYHGNCPDGITAAAVASIHFNAAPNPSHQEFIACNYGKRWDHYLPAVTKEDDVLILDFSFPRDQLLELKERCRSLLVLDHHKSAQADLAGLDFCQFDMERSGAKMTWDHLIPAPAPMFVLYIQDRDLWQWKLPDSREFSAGFGSYPWTVDRVEKMLGVSDICDTLINEGRACLRLKNQQVDIMAGRARWAVFDASGPGQIIFNSPPPSPEDPSARYFVPVANATCFFSEVGERMCELHPDAPFSAYYFDRDDGKRQWGLRSRGGFDCSVVAKLFGGGGHPGAAGFTTNT